MIGAQGAQAGSTAVDDDHVEHTVIHGLQKTLKRSRREPAKGASSRRSAKHRTTAAAARQPIGELLSGTHVARSTSDSGSESGSEALNAEDLLEWLE
jgi:hypothetical protein